MQLIPAMDIIDGEVVRLSQGDYNRKTVYSSDPVETAADFKSAGVGRLHLVDLSGAREGRVVHADLFGKIKRETGCVVEVGGGIRSRGDVELLYKAGIEADDFIMIGSLPFKDPEEFEAMAKEIGPQILLTVDVWGREVRISGWMEDAGSEVIPFIERMKQSGIHNYLVTQIERDGMLSGPDTALYEEICKAHPAISVIVSGGVASMDDLKGLPAGVGGVIVGRAYYENKITLEDIRSYHR